MDAMYAWLEEALGRFHGSPLSAAERQHLNAQLIEFQASSDAYIFSLHVLNTSTSPLVQYFAASTVSRVVASQWAALSEEMKQRTRQVLLHFTTNRSHDTPEFVALKAAQVLVNIGKHEWPHTYPNFLRDVLAMVQSSESSASTALAGLRMLRLVGEEFVSQAPTVRAARQDELASLLAAELTQILGAIKAILRQDGACRASEVTAGALETLAAYMSWMPIEQHVDVETVAMLLAVVQAHTPHSIKGLSCLLELLMRKHSPSSSTAILALVLTEVSNMLEAATTVPELPDCDQAATYRGQLDAICVALVSQQMWRLRLEPERFPGLETFLEPLVRYTFATRSPASFLSTLDVWEVLLDALSEGQGPGAVLSMGLVTVASHLMAARCVLLELGSVVWLVADVMIHFDSDPSAPCLSEAPHATSTPPETPHVSAADAAHTVHLLVQLARAVLPLVERHWSADTARLGSACMRALKAAAPWLSEVAAAGGTWCKVLLVDACAVCLLGVSSGPRQLHSSCAGLLELLAPVAGMTGLLQHPECAPFAQDIHSRCSHLTVEVRAQVYVAFLGSILQSRHGSGFISKASKTSQPDDEAHTTMCHALLDPLVMQYVDLARQPHEAAELLQDTCVVFTALVKSLWFKVSSARATVHECLTPLLDTNEQLLHAAQPPPRQVLQGLVEVTTAVIECLGSLVLSRIERLVHALLQICSAHSSLACLRGVLHIVGFLSTGQQHRRLVPRFLEFLLHDTLIIITRDSYDACAELAEPFFKAVAAVMENHFKVLWTESPDVVRAMLAMLSQAFHHHAMCGPAVELLAMLTSNHRLAHRLLADQAWVPVGQEVIVRLLAAVLENKDGLDFDAATSVVHALVIADMQLFQGLLGRVLDADTRLLPAQREALKHMAKHHDARTFQLNMARICNDLQYFVHLNKPHS